MTHPRSMCRHLLLSVLATCILGACGTHTAVADNSVADTSVGGTAAADTAVAGIPAADAAIADNTLLAQLRPAKFVLLGEVHDNAGQHRLRAALLTRLLADGRSSSVVFEQMDRGHDAAIAAAPRDAESVATAGRLDRAGWGWPLHKPLLDAALAAGADIRGGDLAPQDARSIVRGGPAAVGADLDVLLKGSGWHDADESAAEHDIDVGHCGALPKAMWPGMALAQRARDAALAQAMLQAAASHDRVILITGNGHARRDLGVPRYLIGAGVTASQIVSVGYLEDSAPSATAYDVVQTTSAAERADPCDAFKKR